MKLKLGKKAGFALAVAGATAVGSLGTAVVMAAVPDSAGAIHGCYLKNAGLFDGKGTVRIIDSATDTCRSNETAINWNQTGPKGDKGDPGEGGDVIGVRTTGLDNADFGSANLSLHDLSHRTFRGVTFGNFSYVDASYSVFQNTATKKGSFATGEGNIFRYADLHEFSLGTSGFTRTDFTGANLSGHNGSNPTDGVGSFSIGADFSNFSNANLSGNNFKDANLLGSDLRTANLTGATWVNTLCPDDTNSDDNGNTCIGHLEPYILE